MRRKRDKKNQEEVSFWQSQSDLLTALVLILLLVILLLSLYIMQIPDTEYEDMWAGNDVNSGELGFTPTPTVTDTPTPTPTFTPTPTPYVDGGNGGGDDGHREERKEPLEGEKSAVYVMLIDGDTDLTIKEEGVAFELYEKNRRLMTLNTYYPERISFRDFETTEDGVFYLPEKIRQGEYYLSELTEAAGYDLAEDVPFYLDEYYDWDAPYVVRVPVFPSRNIIRVQMLDKATGQTLPGGSFQVTAAANIMTMDGTMRYRRGEVVSEIICDENGYGESEELYLGSYYLAQKDIPDYYVGLDEEDLEVEVGKKTGMEVPAHLFESSRTEFTLHLTDELYPNRNIEGAVFSVTAGRSGAGRTYTTDSLGEIFLDELEKNTTYYVKQTAASGDYYPDESVYQVHVSADGHIEGENAYTLSLTNWILRVSIGIADSVTHTQIQDVGLSLYDSKDNLIRSWTSTGSPAEISNIAAGDYYVVANGNTDQRYELKVVNTKEVQSLTIPVTSSRSILMLVGLGLGAALLFAAIFIILKRRKKRRAGNR